MQITDDGTMNTSDPHKSMRPSLFSKTKFQLNFVVEGMILSESLLRQDTKKHEDHNEWLNINDLHESKRLTHELILFSLTFALIDFLHFFLKAPPFLSSAWACLTESQY